MKFIYLTIILLLYAVIYVYADDQNSENLEDDDLIGEVKSNELNNERESRQYNGNYLSNNFNRRNLIRANTNYPQYSGLSRNKQQYFFVSTTNIPRDVLQEEDLDEPIPTIRIAEQLDVPDAMITSVDDESETEPSDEYSINKIVNDGGDDDDDDDDDDNDDSDTDIDKPEGRRLNANRRLYRQIQILRRRHRRRLQRERLNHARKRRRLRRQRRRFLRRRRGPERRNRVIQEQREHRLRKKAKHRRHMLRRKLLKNRKKARRRSRKKQLLQRRRIKRLKRKHRRQIKRRNELLNRINYGQTEYPQFYVI